MLITCLKCNGNKKVRAIGFMLIDCKVCDGLGKIAPTKEMINEALSPVEPITHQKMNEFELQKSPALSVKKKRGRPKKIRTD